MHYILIMEFNHLIESDVKETGTSDNTYHLYDDKATFEVEFVRSTNDAITYQFTKGKSLTCGAIKSSHIAGIHTEMHRRESITALLWGILALFLSVVMYFILDTQFLRLIGSGILVLMAIYLFVDFFKQSAGNQLVITTHHGEIRIPCGKAFSHKFAEELLRATLTEPQEKSFQGNQNGRIFIPR